MDNKINNQENIKYFFNIFNGNLLNGAKKLKDYNFISSIGGNNNGYYEISVNVNDSCLYYLSIQYVAYAPNLSFKVNINGLSNNKVYYTEFSSQWSINKPKTYTLPITLNKGENKIKFWGNEINDSPYLGDFLIILPPLTNNLSEGILENNAYIDSNTNFVNAIGGPNNGSSTITINVPYVGIYNLSFEYISSDKSRPLKIILNGLDNKNIYYVPLTEEWNANSKKKFNVEVSLNSGNNTIKFCGDGLNYGPMLGSILMESINNNSTSIFSTGKVFKISDGILGEGASIDTTSNVVTKLGGIKDGYCIVKVPVKVYGDYLIKLNYLKGINGGTSFKIDINGIKSDIIYNIQKNDTKIFPITLSLVAAVNTLKFHGDGKNFSPDLIDFTMELIKDNSSSAFDGQTFSGAIIRKEGIIDELGGVLNGSYIMLYYAATWGQYALYLTLDTSKGTILTIDVSNEINKLTYNLVESDTAIVQVVPVFFKKGNNILIFGGNYNDKAPSILKIDIKLMLTIKDSIYSLSDGFLEKGARVDTSENLVEGLGGINNGSSTIKVNIINEGLYDLNIKYIAENIDSTLRIDVTGDKNFNSNTICILPSNKLKNDFKLNNFRVAIPLTKGINNIKFYGNGKDYLPKLSYIEINESLEKQVLIVDEKKLFYKAYNPKIDFLLLDSTMHESLTDFVKDIGGKYDGKLLLYVKAPKATEYKLEINYLKTNFNESFSIKFTGTNITQVFNPPNTTSLNKKDAKTLTINIFLYKVDLITFFGYKNNNAPLIGNITLTEIPLPKNVPCKINAIKLENGCKKYNSSEFINSIGGPNRGIITLNINTNGQGWYDLGFKYICAVNGRILKLYVNSKDGKTYDVPATKDWQLINAQNFTIPIELSKGENEVKFTGEGDNFAPIIGNFNIIVNSNIDNYIYDTALGTLKNGAKVNSSGLVTNIGGPKSGEVHIKVDIKNKNIYELTIECIPINEENYLEAFINDISYSFNFHSNSSINNLTDMSILKARVFLNIGENIIVFRGKSLMNYTPFLGKFILVGNNNYAVFTKNLPKGSFDITKGTLKNGANVINGFVNDIGDRMEGEVTIIVNVLYSALYNVIIEYRNVSSIRSFLMIDVNGEFDGKIYVFVQNDTCNELGQKEVQLPLRKGDNLIRFYGIKDKKSPEISIISIN